MIKVKLLNRASGIGKTSGKEWNKLTFGSDKSDGTRVVADFWCNQQVASKAHNIPIDSLVYVSAELDESLHFSISDVRPVDSTK